MASVRRAFSALASCESHPQLSRQRSLCPAGAGKSSKAPARGCVALYMASSPASAKGVPQLRATRSTRSSDSEPRSKRTSGRSMAVSTRPLKYGPTVASSHARHWFRSSIKGNRPGSETGGCTRLRSSVYTVRASIPVTALPRRFATAAPKRHHPRARAASRGTATRPVALARRLSSGHPVGVAAPRRGRSCRQRRRPTCKAKCPSRAVRERTQRVRPHACLRTATSNGPGQTHGRRSHRRVSDRPATRDSVLSCSGVRSRIHASP